MSRLRLDVYNALEVSSYLTVQELALQLDSGTPATQAQVRDVLRAEPEVFWPDEERWDLALFHHFADQPRLFRRAVKGGQAFDGRKFIRTVLAEALRLKGAPVQREILKRRRVRPEQWALKLG